MVPKNWQLTVICYPLNMQNSELKRDYFAIIEKLLVITELEFATTNVSDRFCSQFITQKSDQIRVICYPSFLFVRECLKSRYRHFWVDIRTLEEAEIEFGQAAKDFVHNDYITLLIDGLTSQPKENEVISLVRCTPTR